MNCATADLTNMKNLRPSCSCSSSSLVLRPRPLPGDHEDANEGRGRVRQRAFTLIELLVVIAIIAVLAALLFPAGVAIRQKSTLNRARAELKQVEAAINNYKLDKGFYPPDNPRNTTWPRDLYASNEFTPAATNALFYEFSGVRVANPAPPGNMLFETLDGAEQVRAAALLLLGASGVQNVNIPGGDSSQVEGPRMIDEINPFRYVSSVATNNPETFDLWVDVIVGSKTNRVCNWSDKPLNLP